MAAVGPGCRLPAAYVHESDPQELQIKVPQLSQWPAEGHLLDRDAPGLLQEDVGARIGGLAVGAAPAGIRAPQPVANDDLKRLYDEWATEDEVEDHEGLLAPLRQQVVTSGAAAGDEFTCFEVQHPEEGSTVNSGHALQGIPLSQLGELNLEDYLTHAHRCRYKPELDGPWMQELLASPVCWPPNASEGLGVTPYPAQQGEDARQPRLWHAPSTAPRAAAGTACVEAQPLRMPIASGCVPEEPLPLARAPCKMQGGPKAQLVGLQGKPLLLDAAQPVTRCSPAPLASSCSDAAAAAAASSLPVLTTAAGTAGPGQQQRKQPPSTAQRGKPSTVLLRLRKRKQAEAEAAPPLVGTRVLRSQSWRAAPAGPEAERPDHLTGSEGAAQKRQRTAAAAPVTEESGRASAGSADVAATAAVTARAAAPVGGTRRGLSKRAAASSAGGTSGKGGRKKGRKTASCIKERQEVYDRQASSRVLSKEVGDNQSTVHRHKKAMKLHKLLQTRPRKSEEPFKRVVSKADRRKGRLLFSGEQLFHTGLLLGEELRLALWVGGRQLPGGLAAITCRMQQATRQYQLQEGRAKGLLEALEAGSPLRARYTLVLRRRQVEGGMVHVDASLEPQQQNQNQQQWWRRLQRRLQLPL